MIKGYKHLQDCAYIGDDSSEEMKELQEAFDLGLLSETLYLEKVKELAIVEGLANRPGELQNNITSKFILTIGRGQGMPLSCRAG